MGAAKPPGQFFARMERNNAFTAGIDHIWNDVGLPF